MINDTTRSDMAASHELERLTLRLHELIRAGREDEAEVDQIREGMVDISGTLSPERRELLDNLSGDLFMLLRDEELVSGDDPVGIKSAFESAWNRQDWVSLLALVRRKDLRTHLPDAAVAYFRGRCWSSLGYFGAALTFFDHAAELAPDNDNYAYLALDALIRSGKTDEALERANAILHAETTSARRLFKAADVLFHAARNSDGSVVSAVYVRVLAVLERGMILDSRSPVEKRLSSLTAAAYVIKGLCHQHLGQHAEAKRAFTDALAVDPDAEAALTARGLLLLDAERAAALRDFERAVQKGTPLVWPYFYLAHDALQGGEYRRCIDLAKDALLRTRAPVLRANLIEWMAIASMELSPDSRASVELMQDAQTANPLSDRIAGNLQGLIAGKHGEGLSVANDTSSSEAIEGLSREMRLTG